MMRAHALVWLVLLVGWSVSGCGDGDKGKAPSSPSTREAGEDPATRPAGTIAPRAPRAPDIRKAVLDLLVKNPATRFAADVSPDKKLISHIPPDRVVSKQDVLAKFGEPTRRVERATRTFARLPDSHGGLRTKEVEGEVWEYGSTTLMFRGDTVAYAWTAIDLEALRKKK